MLAGVLSPVIARIISDGKFSQGELNLVMNLLSGMGIEITADLTAAVATYIRHELAEWKLEHQCPEHGTEHCEQHEHEREAADLIETTRVAEKIKKEHDKEVNKILAGISSIVGISDSDSSLGQLSPGAEDFSIKKSDFSPDL